MPRRSGVAGWGGCIGEGVSFTVRRYRLEEYKSRGTIREEDLKPDFPGMWSKIPTQNKSRQLAYSPLTPAGCQEHCQPHQLATGTLPTTQMVKGTLPAAQRVNKYTASISW
jgi:hypothetical protein